jgi:hypothetical protein
VAELDPFRLAQARVRSSWDGAALALSPSWRSVHDVIPPLALKPTTPRKEDVIASDGRHNVAAFSTKAGMFIWLPRSY